MPSVKTAREMRTRLIAKFGGTTGTMLVPQHLMLFEVAIDGPPKYPGVAGLENHLKRQRIDAVSVGIWGKTEHLIQGFEIKVSRADLLAELRDPSKAAAGIAACDTWWLALGDADLLKPGDDVPESWGVLAPHGKGLTIMRKPTRNPDAVRDGRFIAAMMQAELRTPRYRHSIGFRAGWEAAERYWKNRERYWERTQDQHIAAGCNLLEAS